MRGMRRYIGMGMVLLLVCMLCGCIGGDKQSVGTVAQQQDSITEDSIKIGLSVDSFIIERWIRDRDVFVAAAKELGAEVNVQDAGGVAEEQINQIEYFIKKQMDAIVVIARDCDALSEVMRKAHDAGIPTICYDRLIRNANCDLYISFDSRMVGQLMAEALIEAIPGGGEIFMIQGSLEDSNVDLAAEGFEPALKGSSLEVVYKANCEAWLAEQAVQYVEEGLERYPDVKGIMCGNDDIASQVIQVLSENQRAGDVIVVGQDGDLAACQRIVEGTQYMTAFKSIDELARRAAEYAVRLGKGEDITGEGKITSVVDDGSYKVPSEIIAPVGVTRQNMDEVIIDGGFHRREDVYLNVDYRKETSQ